MTFPRVQKSALQPQAADAALRGAVTSMGVVDVAVDAAEFPQHPNPQLKIAVVLEASSLEVEWLSASGRAMRGQVACGSSSVMPAEMPYRTRWQAAGRMLLLSFSAGFLCARDAALGRAAVELRPAWSQPDPLLAQLGLAVLAAQQARLASPAYLDAAAEVAMVHLLQRYGGAVQREPEPLLPPHLARVLELIDSQLGDDLSLARLAAAAGLSVYGFARAFTKAVGEPPHRHVLRRRCERAGQLLATTALPVADIAAALGFASQAHLTTAFSRATGVTPARYRAGAR